MSHSKIKWWATYTNVPVNFTVRLLHPQIGVNQSQETFLAPSADKKTRNYHIECWNNHLSLSTLMPNGLGCSKIKWWSIYKNFRVSVIVRLLDSWSSDSQFQEIFLAPYADKQTCNFDIGRSNSHPSMSTLRPRALSSTKIK